MNTKANLKKISDLDTDKGPLLWSPDSKALIFGTGEEGVRTLFPRATSRNVCKSFEGIIPNLKRRYDETDEREIREWGARGRPASSTCSA
jgi:excinuclease UvrABC ATPase subunit